MRHAMIIEMGRAALTSMHRGRLRLRTVLLLGMLVPLVGVGGLAGVVAGERWAARDASDELAEDDPAEDLTGRLTPFVAVVGAALLIAASIAPRLLL